MAATEAAPAEACSSSDKPAGECTKQAADCEKPAGECGAPAAGCEKPASGCGEAKSTDAPAACCAAKTDAATE
jgi:hypothetical protein